MDVQSMSDRDLLKELIGQEATTRIYKRSLLKLFRAGVPHPELRPLFLSRELWKRMFAEELIAKPVFISPIAVKEYLTLTFAPKTYEVFAVMFLDSQNRLLACEEMFRGTLSQTSVYPREVVKRALDLHAAAVVLSHNHPSGTANPSRADEVVTQTLKQALSLVDVRVLDHVICAGGEALSMAERGLV